MLIIKTPEAGSGMKKKERGGRVRGKFLITACYEWRSA